MHYHAKFPKKIGQTKKIWQFFYFSRWQSSAILDFHIPEILMADWLWGSQMLHHAKFHQNRSKSYGDFSIFLKWWPSAILDL